MSLTVVAQKDFRDAGRSKMLWAVTLLFVLFAAGVAYLYAQVPALRNNVSNVVTTDLLAYLQTPVGILVPIIGLMLGYKAIAGETENGSMKLLLSLPHSRWNVVFGKLIGRISVLAVAIVTGFVLATGIILALYPEFSPIKYAQFILLTVLFGSAYVSIGIGLSSLTKSTTKAGVGIFSAFIIFNWLWGLIPSLLNWVINDSFGVSGGSLNWYLLFNRLSPNGAFNGVLMALLDLSPIQEQLLAQAGDPFYLTWWFSLLILIGWIVFPAALGTLLFRRMDL